MIGQYHRQHKYYLRKHYSSRPLAGIQSLSGFRQDSEKETCKPDGV